MCQRTVVTAVNCQTCFQVRSAGGFPIFVEQAKGAHFTSVDGHEYIDFCLGDTGSMAGHAPAATSKVSPGSNAHTETTLQEHAMCHSWQNFTKQSAVIFVHHLASNSSHCFAIGSVTSMAAYTPCAGTYPVILLWPQLSICESFVKRFSSA